jgi:hypothetical protein
MRVESGAYQGIAFAMPLRRRIDGAYQATPMHENGPYFVVQMESMESMVPEGPPTIARQFHWRVSTHRTSPCPVGTPEPYRESSRKKRQSSVARAPRARRQSAAHGVKWHRSFSTLGKGTSSLVP